MSNVALGYNNKVDSGALSGGGWLATLPLVNLKNRKLGRVARSNGLTLANTQFIYDATKSVGSRLLALINHNFSLSAKYRVRASDASNFSGTLIADSGWVDVWPTVYAPENLEWEDDNWWDGKYTLEEIKGFVNTLIIVLPAISLARYWKVEIDDAAANTDGFIQVGRFFIGDLWMPRINPQYGALAIGWETNTGVDTSLSGAESFDPRKPYRVVNFSVDYLSINEGMGGAFELQRQMGIHGEVIYIHSLDDTIHANRRRFYGRFRKLSPLEYPNVELNKTAFEVKETI